MKAARVFASTVVLALVLTANADGAWAEREGPWVYPNKSGNSARAVKRQPGSLFDFFRRKKSRTFDPDVFSFPGRRTGNSVDVAVEEAEPTEKVFLYQGEQQVALAATAFTEAAPPEPLAAAISTELLNPDTSVRVTAAEKAALLAFYRSNGFKPLWTSPDGLVPRGRDVLAFLASSADDGMRPEDYLPPILASFSDISTGAGELSYQARLDLGLSAAVLRYAREASGGRLMPERLTSYNDIAPQPVELDRAMKVLAWTPFPVAYLESLQPRHPAYAPFKTALREKREQLGLDGDDMIEAGERVKLGQSDARIPLVRKRLQRLGYLTLADTGPDTSGDGAPAFGSAMMTTAATGSPDDQLDPELARTLKDFQKAVGIKVTGNLDSLTVTALNSRSERQEIAKLIHNMERLRWLPKELGARHVLVNQAAFELRLMDHGKETWRTKVIVGKPDTQTFAFHDEIEMVVFNPSWGVPQSIIKNEMLPLLRKDPSYLDRLGYRVITQSGKIVRSSSVNWWAVGGKVIPLSVQQPPSDDNALGEIKFLFPNKHDIYMHDTPTKPLFEKPMRAYSHGCVRVENPRRFGELLLAWSEEDIAAKIESGRSETVKLPAKVPVHLTYFTAWPDADGRITFYDDVYGRDDRMERAFNAIEMASR